VTERRVRLEVNGHERALVVDARMLLSDALRHELNCTGVHVGCEQGACGACTVIWNGQAVRSCLALCPQAEGASIETIESIADAGGDLHPVQRALREHHGLQCGFCTPGIVMSLVASYRAGVSADEAKHDVLGGHLCRCTGYANIRDAVDAAWAGREAD
jgi:aerobic-type carbon monoxide dehydrogenase small subunit (CoxS/CutS family)